MDDLVDFEGPDVVIVVSWHVGAPAGECLLSEP